MWIPFFLSFNWPLLRLLFIFSWNKWALRWIIWSLSWRWSFFIRFLFIPNSGRTYLRPLSTWLNGFANILTQEINLSRFIVINFSFYILSFKLIIIRLFFVNFNILEPFIIEIPNSFSFFQLYKFFFLLRHLSVHKSYLIESVFFNFSRGRTIKLIYNWGLQLFVQI